MHISKIFCNFAPEIMILYDYIAKAKANHLWGSLCAISNWAMYKEMQYRIYKAVLETEPERKYGYKVRVASYVCENGILNGGGGIRHLL